MDYDKKALELHKKNKGKLEVHSKVPVKNADDLSTVYTPGVAAVSEAITQNKAAVYDYTWKSNAVAIVSDGSAVLGLGNIGAEAALPVMEGKAQLFKEFGNIDAVPICVQTQDAQEIISLVKNIAPSFGGINLEDIAAPKCFEIEDALQDIGIPVMHDDQHGTAVVILAALLNSVKVTGKRLTEVTVVINGAGSAGIATAKLLKCIDTGKGVCIPVKDIIMCDSKGIIYEGRSDLNEQKKDIARSTNIAKKQGTVHDAIKGADVFLGVSKGNLLTAADIKTMNDNAIVFAMANPIPEIMPDEANKVAAVVGTGRSDFPNQINNSLAFPGIFRGALDAKATKITRGMLIAAAQAIAKSITPSKNRVLPYTLDTHYAPKVAAAVKEAAIEEGVVRS